MPPRIYEVPANVYRDGRLAYAVGEILDWDDAVAAGLIEDSPPPPKPKARGKRGPQRARRPSEDRARRLQEDR